MFPVEQGPGRRLHSNTCNMYMKRHENLESAVSLLGCGVFLVVVYCVLKLSCYRKEAPNASAVPCLCSHGESCYFVLFLL